MGAAGRRAGVPLVVSARLLLSQVERSEIVEVAAGSKSAQPQHGF
jgi:hypothetical protein